MSCNFIEIISNIVLNVKNKNLITHQEIVDRTIDEVRNKIVDINNTNIDQILDCIHEELDMLCNIKVDDLKLLSEALLLKVVVKPEDSQVKELLQPTDVDDAVYDIRSKTFMDDYYGVSDSLKYMLDEFTRDFVRSTLVDFESDNVKSVNNITELNENLQKYQLDLYTDLKEYIESKDVLHKIAMPDNLFNDDGSDNFKLIFSQLDDIFTLKSHIEKARLSQSNKLDEKYLFDIINKYFILKHFDLLVFNNFKDFLNIGDIYFGKHTNYKKKYSFNTGHDYKNAISWREDEKSTPKDVMSHHLLYIIETIPYYDANGVQHGYLDTDLVIYGTKAIKDIYLKDKMKDNVIFDFQGLNENCLITYEEGDRRKQEIHYSDEEILWLTNLSDLIEGGDVKISDVIASLRDNPQIGYSVLYKLLRSNLFKGNNSTTFLEDLYNIFNSLYRTIFSNNRIQNSVPDIYQELTHFLDFTTNLESTLYYLDDNGNWQIREMNPMNIETNMFVLRNSINTTHASGQMDFFLNKYAVEFNKTNNKNEELEDSKKNITMKFKTNNGIEYKVKYYPAKREDRVTVLKKSDSSFKKVSKFTNEDYDNFKEFIKDSIGINLNRDKDLELEIYREQRGDFDQIMKRLLSLSASVFGNAFIMRRESGLTRTELGDIATEWGLKSKDSTNTDITFRSNIGTYNIVGKSESYNLSWLAARRGIAKRLTSRTTMYTAEKTTIASNSLSNLSAERRNLYIHFKNTSALSSDMLTDLRGWGVNREVDLVLSGKQTHTFNFNELFFSSLCIDFLTGYKNGGNNRVCRFMEAVNSDKPNSPRIDIDYNEIFDEEGNLRSAEHFYKKTVDTFGEIYRESWKNIVSDFKELDSFIKNYKKNYKDNKYRELLKAYKDITLSDVFEIDVNDNFKLFNTIAKLLGKTGSDLLNEICTEYNYKNFSKPIALIENVHKRGGGNIELNKAFITNLMRFNRNTTDKELKPYLDNLKKLLADFGFDNLYWLDQQDPQNYFRHNELRLVDDLLTEGAKLSIGTVEQKETSSWRRILTSGENLSWIKSDGDMIFAKIHVINNETGEELPAIEVNDYTDLIKFTSGNGKYTSDDARFDISDNLQLKGHTITSIEIHPVLRSWTAADGFYTGKYQTANVGLTVFSDAKGAKNTNYEEEGAVGDFVKRNVINTATMKQFLLGTLRGITDYLNIAVVEDIKALLSTIATDETKYKVWDGATFTNAFLHYWENNSLSGSITGFTKKPIMHYYFDRYAAGYLQKTASFAINNEKMRDSMMYRAMHYKTSKIEWRDLNGETFDADITKSYIVDENGNKKEITYSDCFYKKNGNYYKIDKVIKKNKSDDGTKEYRNKYDVYVIQVNERGETIRKVKDPLSYIIESNYDLWAMLGGYDSVSFDENTNKLKYSEYSLLKVADVANKIGIVNENIRTFKNGPGIGEEIETTKVRTQSGVYLFMKHSNIHYIATEGAVKKGAANINKYESLQNSDRLNFFKVRSNLFGILLDPTHEADDALVSLMTQVMSGLADRGFSSEAVQDVYQALGRLAREAILDDIFKYKTLLQGSYKEIEDKVANEIVSAFRDLIGTANNLINSISLKLVGLSPKDRGGLIPWSDPSIFSLITSSITSTLNKMAIRVKSFGSLSVLNPSHDTIQLFDGKKLSLYSSPLTLYEKGEAMKLAPEITNHKLYLGHHYLYLDKEDNTIKYVKLTLDDYYDITKRLDRKKISGLREVMTGKVTEIAKGVDRRKTLFGLYRLTYKNAKGELETTTTFINGKLYDPFNGLTINPDNYISVLKVELLGRDLDTYNVFVNGGLYTLYDLKPVYERYKLRTEFEKVLKLYKDGEISDVEYRSKLATYNSESRKKLREIQKEFVKIKKNKESSEENKEQVEFISNVINEDEQLTEEQSLNTVFTNINDYEISSYGVLVPMIYMSKFGLRETDNLSDIVEDKEFFFKRLLQNYIDLDATGTLVLSGSYDFVIKRLNNKNIYLQTKESNAKNKGLKKLDIDLREEFNGKIYRYDMHGNKMYEMSSMNDKVYVDYRSKSLGEVIVTDEKGIKFYIDKLAKNPSDVLVYKTNKKKVGSETTQLYKDRMNRILQSVELFNNEKWLNNNIGETEKTIYDKLSKDDSLFINLYLDKGDLVESGMLEAIKNSRRLRDIWKKSQKVRTSFLRSLDLLAARIPALSMQSFMTMKVEGFTNVGVNDCYISDMQVLLLGSDFDVDKVTLMGLAFGNFGEYKSWSKYMRYLTPRELEITSQLKFPTGEVTNVTDSESKDYYKYDLLFRDGKLYIPRPEEPILSKNPTENDKKKYELAKESFKLLTATYYKKLLLLVEMINKYSKNLDGVKSNLRDSIEEVVNSHNLLEIKSIEEVLMNLVLYRATEISKDIVNILPSLNPIDTVSQPLKDKADESNFGRKDKYNRYGNAVVKLKQLLNNLTGKAGIGITAANGIKTYFALTLFFNQRTSQNLSEKELKELLFKVTVGGKKYHTISNINKIRDEILKDSKLKEEFNLYVSDNDMNDADAVISGIMTLATDNAKELKLSKLNASAEILGLYLYGVTIGVPFDTLAEIFTSNTADVINKRMRGNVFTDDGETRLARVIKNLRTGPWLPFESKEPGRHPIQDFLKFKYTGKLGEESEKSIVLVFKKLMKHLESEYDINDLDNGDENLQMRKEIFADNVQRLLHSARNIRTGNIYVTQQYKEEVIQYIKDMYKIYGDGHFERNVLGDIEQLLEGQAEIGILRSLILNLGVKVMLEDKLSFYDSFSNIIEKRLPKNPNKENTGINVHNFFITNGNSYKVDLIKYCTDDKYKRSVINAYEDIKHTINPFRVIDGLDHFREYLNVAADDAIKLGVSSIFKTLRQYSNYVFDLYKVYDSASKKRYYKRMLDFYLRKVLDKFLRQFTVTLDEDSLVISNDTYIKAKGKPIVTLGTPEGNTAFKLWVESKFIPSLQSSSEGYFLSDNTFVNDLIPKLYTKTLSGNRIRSMSLPADMIPKTELERKIFDKYQLDYDKTTKITNLSDRNYTVADILYLYNMITYGNVRNTVSLTPITDMLYRHRDSIADKYSNFLADFDSNHKIVLASDENIKEGDIIISEDELLLLVAPDAFEIKNKKEFRGPYVRISDSQTGLRELHSIKESVLKADLDKLNKDNKKSFNDNDIDNVEDTQDENNDRLDALNDDFSSMHDSPEDDMRDDVLDLDIGIDQDDDFDEDVASSRRKRSPLYNNYEPVKKKNINIDRLALDTLGRYLENTSSTTDLIPDIMASNFSTYLKNQVKTYINLNNDFRIQYLHDGKYDKVDVSIAPKNGKYKVNIDGRETDIRAEVTISKKNRTRDVTVDNVLLIGEIKERIREKTNTLCP